MAGGKFDVDLSDLYNMYYPDRYYYQSNGRWQKFTDMYARNAAQMTRIEEKTLTKQIEELRSWLVAQSGVALPDGQWLAVYNAYVLKTNLLLKMVAEQNKNPQVDETWGPVSP